MVHENARVRIDVVVDCVTCKAHYRKGGRISPLNLIMKPFPGTFRRAQRSGEELCV